MVAQQLIALLQCPCVADQMVEIGGVGLRNHHVDESAALLTRPGNQVVVGRRNHHQRERAYV